MWRFALAVVAILAYTNGQNSENFSPRSGDELVSKVLDNCVEMDCVKQNVLGYLDNILNIQSDRKAKNIDAAIFKRAARVFKTHEFRFKVPEVLLEKTELVYNPRYGLNVVSDDATEECMPMPLSMAPAEPPAPMYGAPAPSTPSSYEPGWEPNPGGPYQRVWTGNNDAQSIAYSAYYPGTSASSSSTSRP